MYFQEFPDKKQKIKHIFRNSLIKCKEKWKVFSVHNEHYVRGGDIGCRKSGWSLFISHPID